MKIFDLELDSMLAFGGKVKPEKAHVKSGGLIGNGNCVNNTVYFGQNGTSCQNAHTSLQACGPNFATWQEKPADK